MSNNIIALVDGSIYSHSVCDHAAWVARKTDMAVELVHVLGRREMLGDQDLSGSIALGARSSILNELTKLDEQRAKLVGERGRAILEDAEAILRKAGVAHVQARLRRGDLLETIADREEEVSMIVVGKRGEAADFAKGHLGSNLERLIRGSHKPVLVASRAFREIKKVMLAFDGGSSSVKAAEYIAEVKLFDGLHVHLVTVGSPSSDHQQILDQAMAKLQSAGREASYSLHQGQPEQVLAKLVEEDSHDLVVMGAYGHSRIRSLIIGSTTTATVRSCKVPLLLMR